MVYPRRSHRMTVTGVHHGEWHTMVARSESEAGLDYTFDVHSWLLPMAKYIQGRGGGGGTAAECDETLATDVDFL